MVTTHQIRNVLRVYADQLKRRNTSVQEMMNPERRYADRVDISNEARQRQMLHKISERVVSQVTPGSEEPRQGAPEGKQAPVNDKTGDNQDQ